MLCVSISTLLHDWVGGNVARAPQRGLFRPALLAHRGDYRAVAAADALPTMSLLASRTPFRAAWFALMAFV